MRCPHAILVGTLSTRCDRNEHAEGMHSGPGLAEFPDQRIDWLPGDRRDYLTDRDDKHAWDVPAS